MKILIIGAGTIGANLAIDLINNSSYDITVLDCNNEAVGLLNEYDGIECHTIHAENILDIANFVNSHQFIFIATGDDIYNYYLANSIYLLNYNNKIICCIRNEQLITFIQQNFAAHHLSNIVNPHQEITNLIINHFDLPINNAISGIKLELPAITKLEIKKHLTFMDLNKLFNFTTIFLQAVKRGSKLITYQEDLELMQGDILYIFYDDKGKQDLNNFIKQQYQTYKIIIWGDSHAALSLLTSFANEFDQHIVIYMVIDDENLALELTEKYGEQGINIINCNLFKFEVMQQLGIENCDLFISSTKDDNLNIVLGSIAKNNQAKNSVAIIKDDKYYDNMETLLNVDLIASYSKIISKHSVVIDHNIVHTELDDLQVIMIRQPQNYGDLIKDLKVISQYETIYQQDQFINYDPKVNLENGIVIITIKEKKIEKLNEILRQHHVKL